MSQTQFLYWGYNSQQDRQKFLPLWSYVLVGDIINNVNM